MQNWKLGELVWQEIGIIPRRSPFPSAAAQANTRSRQLILTGIHELPEISEFERKERKGIGILGACEEKGEERRPQEYALTNFKLPLQKCNYCTHTQSTVTTRVRRTLGSE